MNNIIVTVGTITYAIKLRKLLSRGGVSSKLVKIVNNNGSIGCTHGVEICESDLLTAVFILKENKIEYFIYDKK